MYFCEAYDHAEAARILAAKLGWKTPWATGGDRYDGDEWLVRRGWLRLHGPDVDGIRWAGVGIYGDDISRPTAEQRNMLSRMGYDPDEGLSPLPEPSGDGADWPW
jgi:hypothetical protein